MQHKTAVIIISLVVVALLAQLQDGKRDEPRQPVSTAVAKPPTRPSAAYVEIRAKQEVQAQLRDPSSAEFSNVVVRGEVACGYVNSRNGFGGMGGPQRFMSRPGVMTALEENMPPGEMAKVWQRLC